MKVLTAFFAAMIACSTLSAQDVRKLQAFDAIHVSGDIDVLLEKGDTETATIEAHGISEDKVSVFVKNGKLKVQLVDGFFYKNVDVKVKVTYRNLRELQALAGADVTAAELIEADLFAVKAGSGAEVSLELKVNNLSASASEGGELELSGSTESQEASALTGGQYDALNLQCNRTQVRANTGGKAAVVALQSLDASVHTGGEVVYSGDPEERNTRNALAGEIRKL